MLIVNDAGTNIIIYLPSTLSVLILRIGAQPQISLYPLALWERGQGERERGSSSKGHAYANEKGGHEAHPYISSTASG